MTKDWKEEFRELDIEKGLIDEGDGTELETKIQLIFKFIKSNFVSKEDFIKRVESKRVSKRSRKDGSDESWNKGAFYYNSALDDIIKELKSTK